MTRDRDLADAVKHIAQRKAMPAPSSFPAKATAIAWARYCQALPGLAWLPLELVERNADKLHQLMCRQAADWGLLDEQNPAFGQWLDEQNSWFNNLVDRIVVGLPDETPPWQSEDGAPQSGSALPEALAVCAEPFRQLIIERRTMPACGPAGGPEMAMDPIAVTASSLDTVSCLRGMDRRSDAVLFAQSQDSQRIAYGDGIAVFASGLATVRQCVEHPSSSQWLQELLREEILPTLCHRGVDAEEFANQCGNGSRTRF